MKNHESPNGYNPLEIEKKWQELWEANKVFSAQENEDKEKKYILVEFPFPSGDGMHMGHVRPYTAADVVARYYRMQQKEVLFPIGWDAFGLPAENYAIKHGKLPAETTAQNVSNIKKQFQAMGYSFDWSREINTTDPNYYKWTQWIFLQFYKAGLAYEATGLINWCPVDKTGLANEEVIDGCCERCGAIVEKKELRQWYLKITEYAEKLLQGLEGLPEWPEAVKAQQANWIGKSVGAEVDFEIIGGEKIKVFTTRADTIFGATYLVLAPEHELIEKFSAKIENIELVRSYVERAKSKDEQDRTAEGRTKSGIELQGVRALNPATKEEIPVWVADYVLGSYGTGAIMAVPAHDARDNDFAKKFDLEIKQVVAPRVVDLEHPPKEGVKDEKRELMHIIVKHPTEDRFVSLKWKTQDWRTFITGGVEDGEDLVEAAKREVLEETGFKNLTFVSQMPYIIRSEYYAAHKNVNRYANAHVLMFQLGNLDQDEVVEEEKAQFEPEWLDMQDMKTLSPVSELAYILDWVENGDRPYTGEGVLINSGEFSDLSTTEALPRMTAQFGLAKTTYKLRDWVFSRQRYWGEPIPLVHCPQDGIVAVPEDQLPVILPEVKNYEPTGTGESPLAAIDDWVNTTCPECGGPASRETNTMPQWAGSSWYYLRYVDAHNEKEFASQDNLKYWLPVDIYFGGMEHTTLHLLYSRFWNIFMHDNGLVPVSEPYVKRVPHGLVLAEDGSKMSKSKGNVVNPDELISKHGADTVRMYELFLGPHEAAVSWSDQGMVGVARFLDRVWYWVHHAERVEVDSEEVLRSLNLAVKKITEDIEAFRFNTVVSSLMSLHNEIKDKPVTAATIQTFLKMMHPLTPHIAEELNEIIIASENAVGTSMQFEQWPSFDESVLEATSAKIVVQVNGKVKETIEMPIGATEDQVKVQAFALSKVQAILAGEDPKKIIFVQDKVINIVK